MSGNDAEFHGLSERVFYWWADHPVAQATLLVLMSALAIVGYVRPSLVRNLFVAPAAVEVVAEPVRPREAPARRRNAPVGEVQTFQMDRSDCLLVATSDNFFTPAGLSAMRAVAQELEALPQVTSVLWLDSVPGLNLFGLPESLLPRSNASPRQLQAGRERTLSNPLAIGQFISADGRTMVLYLRLDWFYVTSDAACTTDIREAADAAASKVPDADIRFQLTGRVPLHLMTANSHLRDSLKYQLIGYSIMLISALILFRGLSAVIIVAVAPAFGVFWTLGMLYFFDLQDNPFNDIIVPVLVSLIGLTDSVHLMAEIRNQRATGIDVQLAARRGVSRVGMACLLTCLTTAIGFASLAWAEHELVRQFGWSCVLGSILTLISVLTVVPLACSSPIGRRLHVGYGRGLVDRHFTRIEPLVAWVLRHDRRVAWIAIALTIILTAISLQLTPDEKLYSGLSESGEAAQALRHLDRSLGGLELGYARVSWDESASDGEVLEVLLEVDRSLESEPLIGHPLGLHELLAALPGEGPAEERMTLLELLPASLKRTFYTPEEHRAEIHFRVQDLGIARYGPVFERLEATFADVMRRYPHFWVQLDGDATWRWREVYQIVMDLARSLGSATLIIWVFMTVAYRSIRIGLISMVPNLLPLAVTATILVLTGQYLELPTVCVFTICAGIAVDDSIHFLTRFQEESAEGGTQKEIIQRAFTGVGGAMLMTTVVLVAGMLTAVFGDARDARLFGMMGAITLVTALFGDVLLLPALLSQFAPPPKNQAPKTIPAPADDAVGV